MGDQQSNITQILAALAAAQPGGQAAFPGLQTSTPLPIPPNTTPGFSLPQIPHPDNAGKLDVSNVQPINSGTVSIAEAIAKARGFAAEKGLPPFGNPERGPARNDDRDSRSYRRSRSPSRSPPRRRDVFRDNYNPYRDERRGDNRGANDRGYRDRSFSPRPSGRRDPYSPPPNRQYNRSPPPARRGPGGEDNSETLSLDSRLVGLVIGRQGETLRKVEADTQTRVQFLDCPEPHTRLCRITGNKMAREDAKTEINRIVRENATGSRPNTGLCEWPPRDASGVQSDEKFVQIMVPDRTVGLIIGRGGETIQDLQERSGCHVNIKDKSVNGLRPVNLTGPARATDRAKDLIMEIVESDTRQMANPQQRESRPAHSGGDSAGGDKVNDSFFVPKDAVGMIIGKGGETIKEMQAATGCKVNILPPSGRNGDREVTLWGPRAAIEQARRDIMDKVEAVKHRSMQQRDEPYGSTPYSGYQGGSQPPSQSQAQAPGPSGTTQPQQPGQPAAGDGSDPYAAYGGYENYVAMWYAAVAAQQQQQQQYQQYPPGQNQSQPGQGAPDASGQTQNPGPPGLS